MVTASIGVAQFNSKRHEKLEALLRDADMASYKAKSSGRNQVVKFSADENAASDADDAAA